ncbi:hypothetical protein CFC21_068755 [Triticum aestivum]|uniref:MLO-like protein n=2 Tax=Triticum aestivum TaxID=4565 RepID=A0A9R1KQ05_WHEAT|nr:hypothetical protein CFC21_068755 [Triticum aestivum]
MAGPAGGRELPDTPTWAVALVCAVMILVSVAMEHALHNLGHWFHKRHKKAMGEALEKMKAELMLVGFISLLLTVAQDPISKICISVEAGSKMLPCKLPEADYAGDDAKGSRRRLLWLQGDTHRRFLAAPAGEDVCAKQVALMSAGSMHQLHIFIFVLAVFHVLYSVVTMAERDKRVIPSSRPRRGRGIGGSSDVLGDLLVGFSFLGGGTIGVGGHGDDEGDADVEEERDKRVIPSSRPRRGRGIGGSSGVLGDLLVGFSFLGGGTVGVGGHGDDEGDADVEEMKQWKKWESETASLEYQFANGQDLSTLHFLTETASSQKSRFDFHKYIKRSLEDDFKVVVGISLKLWFVAVLILFLDFHDPVVGRDQAGDGDHMEMAQEIQDRESVVKGAPAVEPSNKYFWFDRPDWVLFLIHLTLFQNAFQMAHFVWTVATPDLKKCYHQKMGVSIAKVVLGVAAQIMCSYITFPLYALVTQMGSHMKRSVFNEQTAKALTNWRKVEKKKARDADMLRAQMSQGSSPVHLLHNAGARSDDPRSAPASPRAEKGGGGVQHPARRVPPCDGWRSASLPALDAHITGADFCFSTQR